MGPGMVIDVPDDFDGRGTWEFVNRDTEEVHEAAMVKLAAGATGQDLVDWFQRHVAAPPPIDGEFGSMGALGPGQRAWMTLEPGEPGDYVVVCFIPGRDGIPHIMKGMIVVNVVDVCPARTVGSPAGRPRTRRPGGAPRSTDRRRAPRCRRRTCGRSRRPAAAGGGRRRAGRRRTPGGCSRRRVEVDDVDVGAVARGQDAAVEQADRLGRRLGLLVHEQLDGSRPRRAVAAPPLSSVVGKLTSQIVPTWAPPSDRPATDAGWASCSPTASRLPST